MDDISFLTGSSEPQLKFYRSKERELGETKETNSELKFTHTTTVFPNLFTVRRIVFYDYLYRESLMLCTLRDWNCFAVEFTQ